MEVWRYGGWVLATRSADVSYDTERVSKLQATRPDRTAELSWWLLTASIAGLVRKICTDTKTAGCPYK